MDARAGLGSAGAGHPNWERIGSSGLDWTALLVTEVLINSRWRSFFWPQSGG